MVVAIYRVCHASINIMCKPNCLILYYIIMYSCMYVYSCMYAASCIYKYSVMLIDYHGYFECDYGIDDCTTIILEMFWR